MPFTPDITDGSVNPLPVPWREMTANGATTIEAGTIYLNKAGVLAATLAAPGTDMDGAELKIVAVTANAHTVTQTTPGFNGAGTDGDVATFGGAKGDTMVITARAGVWYTVSLLNVTLG